MSKNNIKKTPYWYNDEYMYFSFGGQHSSKYHLFMQNNKQLTIENSVGASSEYSNAMLQEGTYYLGTSRKQKTFKRKCAADGLTLEDYRRMMDWLTVGSTGELVFDSDRYWGWTVVLDNVGDAAFWGNNNNLTVEFELTFKTIGTYLAHCVYPATWSNNDDEAYANVAGTNQYFIPPIIVKDEGTGSNHQYRLRIQDICNKKQDIIFTACTNIDQVAKYFSGDIKFEVSYNGSVYNTAILKIPSNINGVTKFEFDSKKFVININNSIAEDYEYCSNTKQLNGILNLSSSFPVELYTTSIKKVGETIQIELDEQSAACFQSGNYDYICVCDKTGPYTEFGITPYNDTDIDKNNYKADWLSYIGFVDNQYEKSDHIGKYNRTNNVVCLTFADTDSLPTEDIINQYKVYCGYSKDIIITLTETRTDGKDSGEISYSATVTSYNNL